MKLFPLRFTVTYDLVVDNPYKINPIIRALTLLFFGDKTNQIPFYFDWPPPPRKGETVFKLEALNLRGKKIHLDVPELISSKVRNFKSHGFMKPFTGEISVTEEFVQIVRDWQWYWRKPMDKGLTAEMLQLENTNERYTQTIRTKTRRSGGTIGGRNDQASKKGGRFLSRGECDAIKNRVRSIGNHGRKGKNKGNQRKDHALPKQHPRKQKRNLFDS